MERTTLGETGLTVSVAGLGCGGPSRLGQSTGSSPEESERVVRHALDLGITFFDTAEAYGTEEIVGRALAGRRDEFVVSTKAMVFDPEDASGWGKGRLRTGAEIEAACEQSLRHLQTDVIDVYHCHGVVPAQYEHVRDELLPALERLREAGKIRHPAISEAFIPDPGHEMLSAGLDDAWDVVMVGFNLLNPTARERVFPRTREQGIGTLVMFAVRRALSRPDKLREVLDSLDIEDDPLGPLVHASDASSLTELAYRFARHTPGVDVVLTGTGNVEHLTQNVAAINGPPVPEEVLVRLDELFGDVDHISGN